MRLRNQWITGSLVLLWVGGVWWGGFAFGAADEAAQEMYQKRCQSCHGPDGTGNPNMEKLLKGPIPPVTGAALKQKDEAEMLQIIADGKGKMPGYAKILSAEQQRQLLAYIKTLGQR